MFKKIFATLALLAAVTTAWAAVDVNKATEAELDGIKGIGPATSKLILSERKKTDFKSWEDLMARVKGMGQNRATKLSDQGLTVSGQRYKPMVTAVQAPETKSVKVGKEPKPETGQK